MGGWGVLGSRLILGGFWTVFRFVPCGFPLGYVWVVGGYLVVSGLVPVKFQLCSRWVPWGFQVGPRWVLGGSWLCSG